MSRESVAWVFNLDAEDELARGGPHAPTNVMRARVQSLLSVLRALMLPGDEVLWPPGAPLQRARIGRAWCPTPWALEQMRRAGLEVPAAPDPAVLRRVNHRQFANDLGQALPGARFIRTEAALREVLGDETVLARVSSERSWLLKRPLGYAGRGRRKVGSGPWSAADRTWIDAALRTGDGVQVEPLVTRELDCALHAELSVDGALKLGEPTLSNIDEAGTWVSTERAEPGVLKKAERETLVHEAKVTAEALSAAGYFGPFGLDAFRWRAPDGSTHFQPRCEFNARYSMGWATGMSPLQSA